MILFGCRLHSRQFSAETERMNLFTAVNDAMRVALKTDDSAVVFGEVTRDYNIPWFHNIS